MCTGGKCSSVSLGEVITIGPLDKGESVTLQWHDGLIGEEGGNTQACGNNGNQGNKCGWSVCQRSYSFSEECPSTVVPEEPTWVKCRGETATGFGIPMNSEGGNWFMYCKLDGGNCGGAIQASNDKTQIGSYSIAYAVGSNSASVSYTLTQSENIKWRLVPHHNDNFKAGAWATAPSGKFASGKNFACKHTFSSDSEVTGPNTVWCPLISTTGAAGYAAIHFTVEAMCRQPSL